MDIYDITINIHQHIHQTHRPNGVAAEGGRPIRAPPKAAPVCLMDILMDIYGYIINIYGYISYTFFIYSIYIYIYFLDMFHVFSLVRFLIYGVKSRSGHDRSQNYLSHSVAEIFRSSVQFKKQHL